MISIHAPHTGRDADTVTLLHRPCEFQSTRPIRGATDLTVTPGTSLPISIHAPHTGRDFDGIGGFPLCWEFQSTRPIRGATSRSTFLHVLNSFQSTRPIRGATSKIWKCHPYASISIHAPHTGRDDAGDR